MGADRPTRGADSEKSANAVRGSSARASGTGAPGGSRTHTGTLLRGLPLPVGLRGRRNRVRKAGPIGPPTRWRETAVLSDAEARTNAATEWQRSGILDP